MGKCGGRYFTFNLKMSLYEVGVMRKRALASLAARSSQFRENLKRGFEVRFQLKNELIG